MTIFSPHMIKIVHLHGFKCAGTTFCWILEKLYGPNLLYVEKKGGRDRLFWNELTHKCDLTKYSAVTSHTLELPPETSDDQYLFIEFVREPLARIKSAFNFQIKVGDISQGLSFNEYVKRSLGTSRENFMSRRLSCQYPDQQIWSLDNEAINLNKSNLFVGSVESFDESLVLLEELMENNHGMKLDLAYANAQNQSSHNKLNDENKYRLEDGLLEKVAHRDLSLHQNVQESIAAKIKNTGNFKQKYDDFKERCLSLSRQSNLQISVKPPKNWTLI